MALLDTRCALIKKKAEMADIEAVAKHFAAMMLAGAFRNAGDQYWADVVASIEPRALPNGCPAIGSGKAAVRARTTTGSARPASTISASTARS